MSERTPVPELRGGSRAMHRLRQEIAQAARTVSTLLIQGETGSGKGLAARRVHALSSRAARPFVHLDCASLAGGLVESELFGHERGAFTGADSRRPGRFERAADGTIFLDEIGELPLPLQTRLLRVLQDREYERVGGVQSLPMRARVIAATHRGLAQEVRDGRFRADLYYRLRVLCIRVPALRERSEDVPELVRETLPRLAHRLGCRAPCLEEKLLDRLQEHPWPGNVRELHNVLEALVVRHPGRRLGASAVEDLLELEASEPTPLPGRARARASDARRVEEVLEGTGGNVAQAARRLGLARSTLRYRLRKWGIRP